MGTSITLIGLSGSLRRESLNTRMLRACQQRMPQDCTLSIASIAAIPLYNLDVETEHGIPGPVVALKDAIAAADGLLIATPEYNNSMPGVLKNAIDWLSRPAADIPRVFGNLPVAITGATPGAFGTLLAQNAWLPVMRMLGARLWSGGRLVAPRASQLFDAAGNLTDEAMAKRLEGFVADFVADIRATRDYL
jgi:NAD(P)H-dependent FMN reductase